MALELDWEAVARTHVHPLRLEILERIASSSEPVSAVELSRELKSSLGVVAYHVRQLEERRLIQPAGTRPRRGALEHFYMIA